MQRHTLKCTVAKNELVPYRYQRMKAGQIKNNGAGILMKFGDQSGEPCIGAVMAGTEIPKKDIAIPIREAAYQPLSGKAISSK